MAQGKVVEASKLLPRTFREVYAQPKITEQILAIGHAPVKAMIEFQLARLASLMTTGGNLNDDMTDFISNQLIELYPTESIADLRVCFERGAMGRYGEIQRMDGITIGGWITSYLKEKYSEMEAMIDKRKANDVTKEPIEVEGLENIYLKMADDSNKWKAVQEFGRKEYQRKYGNIDQEQVERIRNAEIEGKHVEDLDKRLPLGPLTDNQYQAYDCDGHIILARHEETAKQIFVAALGRGPKKVSR